MDSTSTHRFLIDMLKNSVIPWVERDGMRGIFTALGAWQPLMDLPAGMTATYKSITGKCMKKRVSKLVFHSPLAYAQYPSNM